MRGRASKLLVAAPLVIGGVLILALTVYVTGRKDVTQLESGLLQFVIAAASLVGSYLLGRHQAKEDASAVLEPHGPKAVRRLVNLTAGIQDFSQLMDAHREITTGVAEQNNGLVPVEQVDAAFMALDVHVEAQLRTAGDALEDWRDVLPEQVAGILDKQTEDETDGN